MTIIQLTSYASDVTPEPKRWPPADPKYSSITMSTDTLEPGRYVVDVVKQEDGSVFIGYISDDGFGRFFRKVGE